MSKRIAQPADIGCLVRVSDETPQAAVRQAIALAAATDAHLTVVIGIQTFSAPYTPFWTSMAQSIVSEVNDRTGKQGESLAETIRAEAAAVGVTPDIELVTGPFADVAARAANIARSVDLVVIDQQHGPFDAAEMLIEEALFRSGRPVMIASPKARPGAELRKAIIGWDGSAHAVRAVSDALFVLPSLETLEIVTVSGEKSLAAMLPAEDFARHLARKGLKTILTDVAAGGETVAKVLDNHALSVNADVIVTGAFGHSRLRQFLLGGVTVELTSSASLPVLMAF